MTTQALPVTTAFNPTEQALIQALIAAVVRELSQSASSSSQAA